MRKRAELAFDSIYLACILVLGIRCLWGDGGSGGALLGAMALTLGAGDILHLAPRMKGLCGIPASRRAVGTGKLASSVTSAVYYGLLLELGVQGSGRTAWRAAAWGLIALRILLCCLPQNRWQSGGAGGRWGVLRNLPFFALGAVVVAAALLRLGLFAHPAMLHLPLAVLLSFLFYLPVVLLAEKRPALGMLMMPKTLCYLWIQLMGMAALGLA